MATIINVSVPPDPIDVIQVMIPGPQGSAGPQGTPGSSNVLTIGAVTTGAPGSSASASITGVSPSQTLNLTIPRGSVGDAGPANTLTIGTITTGAPGSSAVATLTGTSPNQILNLTIPQGPAGAGAPDATTTSNGSVRLSGHLGGTAASPTVVSGAGHTHTSAQISDAATNSVANSVVKRGADGGAGFTYVYVADEATSPISEPTILTPRSYVDTAIATRAPSSHTHTAANISDSTATGRSVLTAADAAAARTAIGAGTSSLVIGTTSTTAKAGDYSPPADAAAATASLRTLGTGAQQAAAGNDARLSDARTPTAHTHTATNISDSTATGRSVLTAADAAAARTAIGAGTSSLVIGTTSTTAKAGDYAPPADAVAATASLRTLGTGAQQAAAGNDARLSDARTPTAHTHTAANISDSTATGRSVLTAADAAAARTAIGAGTSSLALGTTGTTAAAGNHNHDTSYARHHGSGTTIPASGMKAGDTYFYTGIGLLLYNGSAWVEAYQRILKRTTAPAAAIVSGGAAETGISGIAALANFTLVTAQRVSLIAQFRAAPTASNVGAALNNIRVNGVTVSDAAVARTDETTPVIATVDLAAGTHSVALRVDALGGACTFTNAQLTMAIGIAE